MLRLEIGTVTICNMFVRIEFMLKSDAVDSQTAETQKRRNTSIQQALTAWVPFPRNRFCLGGIPPGWAVSSKFQQLIGQLHVWWRTPPGDGQGELRGAELLLEGWQRVMPGAGETIDGLPPYMGQLQTCSVFWGVRIKKNPGLHPSFQDATIFPQSFTATKMDKRWPDTGPPQQWPWCSPCRVSWPATSGRYSNLVPRRHRSNPGMWLGSPARTMELFATATATAATTTGFTSKERDFHKHGRADIQRNFAK